MCKQYYFPEVLVLLCLLSLAECPTSLSVEKGQYGFRGVVLQAHAPHCSASVSILNRRRKG